MKIAWLAGALVAAACAGCGGPAPAKQRIVLITIDTLRHDSVAPSGDGPSPMPRTVARAERGLRFTRAYAASSVTQPTHASLFTGRHPWEHGVTRNGTVLAEKHTTVAERLRAAGFTTAAVVASFPLHRRFGYAQGFDEFVDAYQRSYMAESWEDVPIEQGKFYSLADDVTQSALALLDAAQGERQFFWFHYFDPHDPYGDATGRALPIARILIAAQRRDPQVDELVRQARELYERDLSELDRQLDRLFRRLEVDDERYATSIVFTSDHGESFGEHGSIGHGNRLTEEEVRVPLFIVAPGLEPAVRSDTAGSIDVAATLLALAGLPAEELAGRDLTGAPDRGAAAFGMRRTFAKPRPEQRLDGSQVQVGGLRFFTARDGALLTGDADTVTLGDQPDRPLGGDRAEALRVLFGAFAHSLETTPSDELLDPDVQATLEALGYVR